MSLWKMIFGRNFEESLTEAEDLLRSDRPGEALLELEKALGKTKDVPEERVGRAREMVVEAKRQLAEGHIESGKNLLEAGDLEQAIEFFETAVEVASDDETRTKVQKLLDSLEAADAREAAEEEQELTDEERFEVFAGAWEDEHFDELEGYGEAFKSAFLLRMDGKAEESAAALAELLEDHPDALFLWLQLGAAQAEAKDFESAKATLKEFIRRFVQEEEELADDWEPEDDDDTEPPPFAPGARISAHDLLSRIYEELEEYEAAEKELETLVELLPEKSDPYIALGAFLRDRGRLDESLKVLEAGEEFMGSVQPDMRVPLQLGLTLRKLGRNHDAIASLKAVLDSRAALNNFDFPHTAAVPLAKIYEEEGQLKEASDLYRHLADGSHKKGHFRYNVEAARLLIAQDETEIAHRHLTRARELAADDDDKGEVEELFDKLEA